MQSPSTTWVSSNIVHLMFPHLHVLYAHVHHILPFLLFAGGFYRNGTGVAEDPVEAARLYKLAAEQGHAGAQYNLGE
jgi:hypothetical protein